MAGDEYGDFQTPAALARRCVATLALPDDARVLEPTCGTGAFLAAAAEAAPGSERVGVELQPEHALAAGAHGKVVEADVFRLDLRRDLAWDTDGPLYVIGNPPWVTSAQLSRLHSVNVPEKSNHKGATGLDAVLGAANFDVSEYVIVKVIAELADRPFTLGMLCKTQVARNVVEHAARADLPVAGAEVRRIDAARWFDASVDACWLTVRIDPSAPRDFTAAVHASLDDAAGGRFGVVDGRLVADVERYAGVRAADGTSPYEWRSGLKHDASAVFELVAGPTLTTRAGAPLDLEQDWLHPFVKSTDLFRGRHTALRRWVIVPQREFGADTAPLAVEAPKLWAYLLANADVLDGRRSSIYRNRPRFTVFGHGPYTYAPYKVAISGLHKTPVFRIVGPVAGRPAVLDDTCYFLPFDDAAEALAAWALLSSRACTDLIESLVFWDAKRPITKKLLSRLDLRKLPADPAETLAAATEEAARSGLRVDPARFKELLG